MKNFFLILPILLFINCRNDSNITDTSNSNNPILVTKITYPPVQGVSGKLSFKYAGDKITEMYFDTGGVDVNSKITFTYNGDLISKMNVLNDNNIGNSETTFTYDGSGRLIKSVETYSSSSKTTTYTYSSNKITITGSRPGEVTLNPDGSFSTYKGTQGGLSHTIDALYDNKNNPFKNVRGWSKIGIEFFLQWDGNPELTGGLNNFTNYNHGYKTSSSSTTYGYNSQISYIYNESNFPSNATKKFYSKAGVLSSSEKFTYEYNHK